MSKRRKLRNGLAVVILALATSLALFIVINLQGNTPEEGLDALPKNIDLSLKKINYTETHEGRQVWTLVADSAAHNLTDGIARIESIRMTFFDPELGDLLLTAAQGELSPKKQEVTVRGEVEVRSPRGYHLLTEQLDYREADRVLKSAGPVRLHSKNLVVQGDRLRLNVADRSLTLTGHVRAEFPHGLNGLAP
jgi:LPS export ABC transporter protein LptC